MSNWWQNIQRALSGGKLPDAGVGLETSIDATSPWPVWMLVLLVAIVAVVVLIVYARERESASAWRKGVLAGLRILAVGLLAFMLMGWTVQRHRTDLPDIVVLVDVSQSMGTVDHYDDARLRELIRRRLGADKPTRLNLAKNLLLNDDGDLLAQLRRRSNLKVFLVGATSRQLGGESGDITDRLRGVAASETSTRLGRAVRDVLEGQRGRPTAAVILLTDGITTEGKPLTDAAEYARRKAAPLYIVALGNEHPPRDLRLSDLLSDDVAFVNDLLQFEFKLTSQGIAGSANVRLRRAGDSAPLAQQTLKLDPSGAAQTIRLAHRPDKEGEVEYIVEVEQKEGEANTDNNRLAKKVRITNQTIRVLLVQAYPSYEFRFLKTLLERELNPEDTAEKSGRGFHTVLQEADREYVETDKSAQPVFPVSRDELFRYDVLIFGDANPALLSHSVMENIYEFVTVRGGSVIFIAGPRYTPLAYRDTPLEPLFPMNLATVTVPETGGSITDEFRPRLTPLGLTSPPLQLAADPAQNAQLWDKQLPPLRWFARIPDLRPGARVLAEHPTQRGPSGQPLPIIALQFTGAGKVVFHATDETHRWRFRRGDVYFGRYWIQMIRYLCRAKLLGSSRTAELTSDRGEYRRGDVVRLRVRFLDDRAAPEQDDGVTVVLERQGGQRQSVTLRRNSANRGVFEGTVSNLVDGDYRSWMATPAVEGQPPAATFRVAAPPGELARTQTDLAEMKEAAHISSGRVYRYQDAGNLLRDLPRGRQVRIESLPPEPLWNIPLLAAIFVTLVGSEWLLRKRWGLV